MLWRRMKLRCCGWHVFFFLCRTGYLYRIRSFSSAFFNRILTRFHQQLHGVAIHVNIMQWKKNCVHVYVYIFIAQRPIGLMYIMHTHLYLHTHTMEAKKMNHERYRTGCCEANAENGVSEREKKDKWIWKERKMCDIMIAIPLRTQNKMRKPAHFIAQICIWLCFHHAKHESLYTIFA